MLERSTHMFISFIFLNRSIYLTTKKLCPKASHFDVNFARRLVTRRRETSFARRRETYRKSSRDVLEISHGMIQYEFLEL